MTDSKKLLFVGADLSGIQAFLYNITSYKAAVSLKGRSWYLENYLDRLVERLLSSPEISPWDGNGVDYGRVYCSGGKFYAIIEDTPSANSVVNTLQGESERELWDAHHGLLGITMCAVPFMFDVDGGVVLADGTHGNIGLLWQRASAAFAKGKAHKFANLAMERFDTLFRPMMVGDDTRVCALTGIESADCVLLDDEDEGQMCYVLPSVMSQIQKGDELRRKENLKTFVDYAAGSWLGVLRMDVDGLGARFVKGFASMEDYRRFSDRLADFFKVKVKKELACRYAAEVMVLYAGGDDLFVVGRWDRTIEFACAVHDAFASYFESDGLTLSGGVVVVDAKFPIAKAAELAGDAEDAAKRFHGGEKNAFSLLGQCVSWKGEFQYVRDWMQRMATLCENGSLSRSILHKLMSFNDMRSRGEDAYLWNAAYYLSRFKKDKKNAEVNVFCDTVRSEIFSTKAGGRNLELLALAARWAELKMRNKNTD